MNNKLSVQDADRCVKCGDQRKYSDNLEGKCRYERVIEDIASSVCGCKCEFPSPSVSEAEDKNSVSPKPKAPSHSSVVVAGDSSLNADQWQLIETAPKNRKVIVAYLNPLNKWRRVMATYYADGTLECETNESGYAPEGWYEECETQETLWPVDGEPICWTDLPPNPITQVTASASAPSREGDAK